MTAKSVLFLRPKACALGRVSPLAPSSPPPLCYATELVLYSPTLLKFLGQTFGLVASIP